MSSNRDANVDIIFVGDPIGQNLQSWEESFGHSHWFKEGLPKQFVNARSLYYHYHNQNLRDVQVESTNYAAHDLLSEWANLEAQSPARQLTPPTEKIGDSNNGHSRRPVLFVCQNLGGPLVEEALLLSESEEKMHALSMNTFGIVFLGSPHPSLSQGSMTSLPETPVPSNSTHSVPQMRQNATVDKQLARLKLEHGRPHRPYMRVYFCQETSTPCPGARELHRHCLWSMVPQGWLSESAEKHYMIPKTLPQDVTRANVERVIVRLSEEAARYEEDFRLHFQSECSLLHAYLRERYATSGQWLVDSQAYHKWVNEAESPMLWLSGRPGTGKSFLCSTIVKDLQERQEQCCAITFCFFDSRKGEVSSARYILKAFTYQLREYIRQSGPEYLLRSTSEKLTKSLSLESFQRNLRTIFVSVSIHAPVFLLLDGLDEQDEELKEVIMQEILQVNRSRGKLNAFRCAMSSRSACEARISPEDIVQIDLNTEPGVQHDMLNFATTRLANIYGGSPKQMVPVLALAKQLCSRANGIFLWLALAIEDIQSMENRPNLLQIVNLLPASIDAFYQRALQQIPPQDVETAQKVFSWLTVASRFLYLPELREALAIQGDHSQFPAQPPFAGKELGPPNTQSEIQRICGGLVTITTEGIVRLRHSTVRDYLFASKQSSHPRHPVLAAHEILARACLVLMSSVLKMDGSAQQLGRVSTSSLTKYAAVNWSVHYRLSETYSRNLAGTLQRCLNITLNNDCQSFSIPSTGRSVQIAITTLRISAFYGLVSLTHLCLQMGMDPRGGSCFLCETPLAIAAEGGHLEAAKILQKGTANAASKMSYSPEERIHLAVAGGFADVAKTLLDCGTKVDTVEHNSGKTLLHVAAESGRLNLVKLLMGYNANVNTLTPIMKETPLHLAAVHGHIHVVKYLVDGRHPSTRELELYNSIVQQSYYQSWTEDLLTNEGTTQSIVWEVEARENAEEHIGMLRSFSARYSNINLRTSTGHTALDLAAANGYNDVVRFLIEKAADVNSEGDGQCVALQAAVENGHLETVKLLLAAKANMSQPKDGLASSLRHACKKGHDAVADFIVWHCFNAELSAEQFPWPVLCLPIKTAGTVVRDTLQETKFHKKLSKLGTHTRFKQRLTKMAERPKD